MDSDRIKIEFLIIKAQMGDDQAFIELVELYKNPLLYYIHRLCCRRDLAEDVLQEVWIHAYRSLPKLRAHKAFSVWVYRIAHAQAMEILRKEGRYIPIPENYDIPQDNSACDDDHFSEQEISILHEALDCLKLPLKEVLVLRYLEDMSYQQIAEVTGCPDGTIKSRIYYAKIALRKEMEAIKNGR